MTAATGETAPNSAAIPLFWPYPRWPSWARHWMSEYAQPSDRYADFHCPQRTFIRKLRAAGVKGAQQLARHTTIMLTMDVYQDDAELEALGTAAKLTLPIHPLENA